MTEHSLLLYGLVAVVVLYLWQWMRPNKRQLSHIPAIGPTTPLLSYWGAVQWMFHGADVAAEGYDKYKGQAFKVANFTRWVVILTGPKQIEDLRKAGDDELSFVEASNEELALEHTAGYNMAYDAYHLKTIRTHLTNNIYALFPYIQEEIVAAFGTQVPVNNEWKSIVGFEAVIQIVAMVSNRAFVGLPHCRNPEYIKLAIQFTVDYMVGASTLSIFPDYLKAFASHIVTRIPSNFKKGVEYLGPEIERRLEALKVHGLDYPDKPFDFLSWLIDTAEGDEKTASNLSRRILMLDLAAIHTSTISFTHALFHVAASPEYTAILRQEAEEVISNEGWSKESLGMMHKLDSFMKECQRMYSVASVNMIRKAMKDVTFSDGTFVPEGTIVMAAMLPMQHDSAFYKDADIFNPWRFSDIREREGDSPRHNMVNTSVDYLTFGLGRHSCPGRFFASNMLKMMLIHVITNYDVRMERDGVIPKTSSLGAVHIPSPTAKVLFRKRQT